MDLDKLLTLEECAAWLRIERHALSRKSSGRRAAIPAIRNGRSFIRFHPRTVLAKFAHDAGLSPEVIAASFQEMNQKSQGEAHPPRNPNSHFPPASAEGVPNKTAHACNEQV